MQHSPFAGILPALSIIAQIHEEESGQPGSYPDDDIHLTLKHDTMTNMRYTFGPTRYDLSARAHLMGIVNVTPDSFSDGGSYLAPERAVDHALRLEDEGADFIDIGGESTRPGAVPIPIEEELERVIPVVEKLRERISIPISIDTYKSTVAEAALRAGAVIVNDISGLRHDPSMASVIARYGASAVIMHMQGTPREMQVNPTYEDVVKEVKKFLRLQVDRAVANGIAQVIVDPGIGFGKTVVHNLQLIRNLPEFSELGCPLLVGPSRKSFIGTLLDLPVAERLEGTAAAVTACILRGASILRVHDVRAMKRVAIIADAIRKGSSS